MGVLFKERSRITAKGQTTVPKAVRQALGVSYGGEIAFVVEDGRVSVVGVGDDEADPVIETFLAFLAHDMAASPDTSIAPFPAGLAARITAATAGITVDPDEAIDGPVAL